MSQQDIIADLPSHLRPFVKTQNYADYTPRDQALWRFIMKHLARQLRDRAHPVYLEGLQSTGIALDHIPSIDEMNECMAKLGWRAVVVDGFIPPAIFMEFQALNVLVIALEMRSTDHVFYTPAPDIVHESAGHAPFIVDIDYAEFLQSFGEVGMKAIATREDMETYEAIRKLSIIKECRDSTTQQIEQAETELQQQLASAGPPSEAALLTRLHWWTVEYGLVGELTDYRIFGAGLLSSLGESKHCQDDTAVKKIPLTLAAIESQYDITREQPQLFVAHSCKHLSQVLEDFAASMCFRKGGAESLRTAIAAGSICTARLDSGMQVSGIFDDVLCDPVDKPIYITTTGPTQLAYKEKEITGHGVQRHVQGFGSPVGQLRDFSRCLSQYTVDELKAHNIAVGQHVKLDYLSGISVQGILRQVHRQNHRNLILSFDQCLVQDLAGRVLFDPAWGNYDLAVGCTITSVYGGAADREKLQLHRPTPSTATKCVSQADDLMDAYSLVDSLRRASSGLLSAADEQVLATILDAYPEEWLLRAELLELHDSQLGEMVLGQLEKIGAQSELLRRLTDLALEGKARGALPDARKTQ